MADKYTPEKAANGKELLRIWRKRVERNFTSIFSAVSKHINGTADRHTADMIDYSDTETVGEKFETVDTKLEAASTKLENKVDKVSGKGLIDSTFAENVDEKEIRFFDAQASKETIIKPNLVSLTEMGANICTEIKGEKFEIHSGDSHVDIVPYSVTVANEYSGTGTKIEPGEVTVIENDYSASADVGEPSKITHYLTQKANKSDLILKADLSDLAYKVDKVEGKSLIDENVANQLSYGKNSSMGEVGVLGSLSAGGNAHIAGFIKSMSGDITADFGNVIANVYSEDENKVIQHKLSDKVDKVSGKGLSSNDFTDTAKSTVDAITLNSETGTLEISKNIKLTGNGAVTSDYCNVLDTLKVGYLGDNKWAFRMSAASGFSASGDVTATLDNITVHRLSQKANKSDVLTKTNTAKFTPTGDYQPATKKYVDDAIAALKSELGLE